MPRTAMLRDYYVPSKLAKYTALHPFQGEDPRRRGGVYRLWARMVGANSHAYDTVLGLPGRLEENWLLLRDPRERRLMRQALRNDKLLTAERRKAIFSIMLWFTLITWALVGTVVAIVNRDALDFYRRGYVLFFYSLATSLFLPTPFEIILGNSVKGLGVFWTILVAAVAKTVGSWIVLMMGDKANEGLNQILGKKGIVARLFRGLQTIAQRYGYVAIFVILSIPFMSDTIPLFMGAMLKMRKVPFLIVTFCAIVLRSLIFLYGGNVVSYLGGI